MKDTENIKRREFLKQAGALTLTAGLLGCESDEEAAAANADAGTTGDVSTEMDASDTTVSDATLPDTSEEDPDAGPPDLPDYEYDGALGPETLFSHGVASGDPLSDAVILWTRVSPTSADPVEVWWEVSLTADFSWRVSTGTVETTADRDFTVKIDATELEPGTTYFYRFFALGRESVTGRTRTAPTGNLDRLRLALASCANYAGGYFTAYRSIAARADLDAVLHLGDYIYEYAGGSIVGRTHSPNKEIVTLDDYRGRYAQYRTDPDLQEAHRQHPFIVVWDDHESANNAWKDGAGNHSEGLEGTWADRKEAAIQAYHEWQPIREQSDLRIFRRFQFGDLVDLMMLDTRLFGRDKQIDASDIDLVTDPTRSLLGTEQETWLADGLMASETRWRLLGQQVVMFPLQAGGQVLNNDQWDAYQATRDRLFDTIEDGAIDNVVVLTGDIHSSWASECPRTAESWDGGNGSLCVEFVTPGITSGFELDPGIVDFAIQLNPHIAYGNVNNKGYTVIDVTPERTQAAWFHLDTVATPDGEEMFGAAYSVADGAVTLDEDDGPAEDGELRPLAP